MTETVFYWFRWFHGKISREDAENFLKPRLDGLFLVRESTNFPGDYTLCVCFQNKVEHYRVKSHSGKLTIDDEEFFDNLEELIEHYKNDADGLCTKLVKALSKDNDETKTKTLLKETDDLCIIPEQELEVSAPHLATTLFFYLFCFYFARFFCFYTAYSCLSVIKVISHSLLCGLFWTL